MSGLDNIFEFLTKQCENAKLGFEEGGILRPFAEPVGDAEDFLEESLDTMCTRQEEEDKYVEAVNAGTTKNIHADMMVPSLKNDFIAAHHRDLYLRHHSNRIRRFIAEAYRRSVHAENFHKQKKEAFTLYEALTERKA